MQDAVTNAQAHLLDQSQEQALSLFRWRFMDPAVESEFREWRIATSMPFARIGYIGSAPSWAALFLAIAILAPSDLPVAGPPVVGWVLILLILTGLTYLRSMRAWVMPLAALANCAAGFLVAWLLYRGIDDVFTPSARAGVMAGGVLVVMYFGFAIFRIPPRLALMGITPYLLFAMHFLILDVLDERLGFIEAAAFCAVMAIAFAGGLFVCSIIELVTRRTFAKDRIIRSQQRLLSDSRDAIRRYVPPRVAERIIRGAQDSVSEPKRAHVTMLFCDIAGFTAVADHTDPGVMAQVLNDYLSAMSEIVDRHHGTVNEFAGDGLMALFGAPDASLPPEQARNSIAAGLEMQARMLELSRRWRDLGLDEDLQVRVGINSGMVSVGSYGSQGRMTYSAVGAETNVAARIEGAAAPGQIWVSRRTYALAQAFFAFECEGEFSVKGVSHPIQAYRVIGERAVEIAKSSIDQTTKSIEDSDPRGWSTSPNWVPQG